MDLQVFGTEASIAVAECRGWEGVGAGCLLSSVPSGRTSSLGQKMLAVSLQRNAEAAGFPF